MSFIGRGRKLLNQRNQDSFPVNSTNESIEREAYQFQQIYCTNTLEQNNEFSSSYISPTLSIITNILQNLNIGSPSIVWSSLERRWQCQLVNGACSGLLIDACKTVIGVIQITLIPPNADVYQQLLEAQTGITKKLAVLGDIEIKVICGLSK